MYNWKHSVNSLYKMYSNLISVRCYTLLYVFIRRCVCINTCCMCSTQGRMKQYKLYMWLCSKHTVWIVAFWENTCVITTRMGPWKQINFGLGYQVWTTPHRLNAHYRRAGEARCVCPCKTLNNKPVTSQSCFSAVNILI